MSELMKQNKIEINKMNNFLECFSCKREEEFKHCFDKCGFWKSKEEMETYYTELRIRNFEKSEKLLHCSLYNEESIKRDCKLRKLYEQRLLDCLLYHREKWPLFSGHLLTVGESF